MSRLRIPVWMGIIGAAAAFLLGSTARAGPVSLAFPEDAFTTRGAEVTVPLRIQGTRRMGALQCGISFDPAILEAADVSSGAAMPPVLIEYHVVSPSRLRVALAGNEAIEGDAQLDVRFLALAPGQTDLVVQAVAASGTIFWVLVLGVVGCLQTAK